MARIVKNLSKFSDNLTNLSSGGGIQNALSAIENAASKFDILVTRACDGDGVLADLKETVESVKAAFNKMQVIK
ncbi:hypothetical protein AGMMS49921_03730 [Endomicrobiia bacterium]|nr:hypothetical protein AGMMS49921_03730 [Endomicrobiia bacterium]